MMCWLLSNGCFHQQMVCNLAICILMNWIKIDLYRMVQSLQHANDPAGQKLFTAYSNVLPPSILDWIIYFIMRIFAVIF